MDLYDVMRTTSAVREFTGDPLPDDVLHTILDNARFAPSGGNRQGARIIVVRDQATRRALADLTVPGARRYTAQRAAGEGPWNAAAPTRLSDDEIAATEVPDFWTKPVLDAAVVLVVCVDLAVAEEPRVRELFGVPDDYAVACVLPLGKPVRQLTRLTRASVEDLTRLESWDGGPLR